MTDIRQAKREPIIQARGRLTFQLRHRAANTAVITAKPLDTAALLNQAANEIDALAEITQTASALGEGDVEWIALVIYAASPTIYGSRGLTLSEGRGIARTIVGASRAKATNT